MCVKILGVFFWKVFTSEAPGIKPERNREIVTRCGCFRNLYRISSLCLVKLMNKR